MLQFVIFFLSSWYFRFFSFISRDENDSISLCSSVGLHLGCFVLEGLHVLETIKKSVCSGAHNDVLLVCLHCLLYLAVLFITVSLQFEVFHVVLFLTHDDSPVIVLESIVVLGKTFNELISFLFFVITTKDCCKDHPNKLYEEYEDRS